MINNKKSGIFKVNKIRKGKNNEFKIEIGNRIISIPQMNTYKCMGIMLMNNNRSNNHVDKLKTYVENN